MITSDSVGEKPLVVDASGEETFAHRVSARTNVFTIAGGQRVSQVSAAIIDGALVVDTGRVSQPVCDAARAQLTSDLNDLATLYPHTLTAGQSWSDSSATEACAGELQGTATAWRTFTVLGDTALTDGTAIILGRRDSTLIAAEGVLDQHPTTITGRGESTTLLYVLEATGNISRSEKRQILKLSISAENHTRAFVQKTESRLERVR